MTSIAALENANVFYGTAQALHSFCLNISSGETVALVGRNGAGKTTILRALMGLLPCRSGRRLIDGVDATTLGPEAINRLGLAYVPEDRQVFSNLTVEENLQIARLVSARNNGPRWGMDDVWALFPRLLERRDTRSQSLSGGEQQMLSIARALLCNPRLLLLDEPTEGLAPLMVTALVDAMSRIASSGVAIVIVEQNFRVPFKIADRFVIIDSGAVEWIGDRSTLMEQKDHLERLISV